ncbi:MAG: hypothetical protein BWZ03_00740 [bacterium ADurb.BinA186]|nr:MAG: hypothetical protein BWZ03_00740 [bacterium ADurb.BinA186]
MLILLPELTKVVTSDKRSHSSVPYGSRRYLPQELQGLTFQVMKEFDFAGDGKILAIGGTDKEINILSTEPYNLAKENICAINVLPYENPHYLADMTLADHMELFKNKFDFTLLCAVPIASNNLDNTLRNIASSLKNIGIFVAFSSNFGSDESVDNILFRRLCQRKNARSFGKFSLVHRIEVTKRRSRRCSQV